MLQNILKFKYSSSAIATMLFVFAFGIFVTLPKSANAEFTLVAHDKEFAISDEELTTWKNTTGKPIAFISFDPETNAREYILQSIGMKKDVEQNLTFTNYNLPKIYRHLKTIEPQVVEDPQDALFKMDGNRVIEFNPGTSGKDLDIKGSLSTIAEALDKKAESVALNIFEIANYKPLSETNDLGIKELIAHGDSDFSGSPANRIFNIHVGVKKESGIILKPGEEFSFNDVLGPVDGEHGFKPELVIKRTGTVPEFGGGLCQVSSTVFRAAMNAGLPITARRNHSYAVQYYAPQGTDATIYPGVQDLKFVNDTGHSILIWATFPEKSKLRFSFYGTRDDREIAFDGPYTYDRKSDGSMKATWTRFVTMGDGLEKKDVFNSVYQPPALFHKTEEFPPAPPTTPPVDPNAPTTPTEPTPTQTTEAPTT